MCDPDYKNHALIVDCFGPGWMSSRRSSSASESANRNKAIRIMMARTAVMPTTPSVKAMAQLAATSREAREEYSSQIPPAIREDAFWDDMMDRIIAKGKGIDDVQVSFIPQTDDTGMEINIGRGDIEIIISGFMTITTVWSSRADGPPLTLYLGYPMTMDVPMKELIHALYNKTAFRGQTTEWRGDFVVNLISGLMYGLAKAGFLHKALVDAEGRADKVLPKTSQRYLDVEWEDEDEVDGALDGAIASTKRECKELTKNVPLSYIAYYRTMLRDMLRAAGRRTFGGRR